MRIEDVLGTVRGEKETWQDVFARINKTRGLDLKTLANVIIYILEELDERKETRTEISIPSFSTEVSGIPAEGGDVPEGTGSTKEQV